MNDFLSNLDYTIGLLHDIQTKLAAEKQGHLAMAEQIEKVTQYAALLERSQSQRYAVEQKAPLEPSSKQPEKVSEAPVEKQPQVEPQQPEVQKELEQKETEKEPETEEKTEKVKKSMLGSIFGMFKSKKVQIQEPQPEAE